MIKSIQVLGQMARLITSQKKVESFDTMTIELSSSERPINSVSHLVPKDGDKPVSLQARFAVRLNG